MRASFLGHVVVEESDLPNSEAVVVGLHSGCPGHDGEAAPGMDSNMGAPADGAHIRIGPVAVCAWEASP